ncbi:MAG TPA: DUF2304 domain-containing protein [Kineosporiaceae bacterium]|jgi:hypothetical protein|nr:DUF2304 domain-containing protein [Kineosporiaceae bacterium]
MVQIAAVLGAAATLVIMVEMLRRRQLQEKYAVLWLALGVGLVVMAIFPGLLVTVGRWLGFVAPSNLLFLVAGLVLLLISVHLSWEVSRLEDETRILAEEVALLRVQVESASNNGQPLVSGRPRQSPAA